jgi:hypothetical protein
LFWKYRIKNRHRQQVLCRQEHPCHHINTNYEIQQVGKADVYYIIVADSDPSDIQQVVIGENGQIFFPSQEEARVFANTRPQNEEKASWICDTNQQLYPHLPNGPHGTAFSSPNGEAIWISFDTTTPRHARVCIVPRNNPAMWSDADMVRIVNLYSMLNMLWEKVTGLDRVVEISEPLAG